MSCTSASSGLTRAGNALGRLRRALNSEVPPPMDAMPRFDLATAHGFLAKVWRFSTIGSEGIGSGEGQIPKKRRSDMLTAKSCESVRITSPAEFFVKVAGGPDTGAYSKWLRTDGMKEALSVIVSDRLMQLGYSVSSTLSLVMPVVDCLSYCSSVWNVHFYRRTMSRLIE